MTSTAAAPSQRDRQADEIDELYAVVPDALAALPPLIRDIAVLFDGSRSARAVAAAAQISAAQCAGIIKKLTALGVLRRPRQRRATGAPRGGTPPGTPAFSAVEEAFFAADVAPIDECNEPFQSVGERFRAAVCEVIVRLQGQRSFM